MYLTTQVQTAFARQYSCKGKVKCRPISGAAKAALAAARSRMVSSFLNFFLDLGTFLTESEPVTVTSSQEVSDILPLATGGAAFFAALLRGSLAFTEAPAKGRKG